MADLAQKPPRVRAPDLQVRALPFISGILIPGHSCRIRAGGQRNQPCRLRFADCGKKDRRAFSPRRIRKAALSSEPGAICGGIILRLVRSMAAAVRAVQAVRVQWQRPFGRFGRSAVNGSGRSGGSGSPPADVRFPCSGSRSHSPAERRRNKRPDWQVLWWRCLPAPRGSGTPDAR